MPPELGATKSYARSQGRLANVRRRTDLMPTRTFDLTAIVPVEPTAAIDFLLNLTGYRGLHPFPAELSMQRS